MAKTGRVGRRRGDRNSEKRKGRKNKTERLGEIERRGKKKYRENEKGRECLLWLSFRQPRRDRLKDNAATSGV